MTVTMKKTWKVKNVEVGDADEAAVNAKEDVVAAIEHAERTSGARVELYDSGSTCHLSPYHADFQNFEDLPARPFKTANTQQFDAVGCGNHVVEVPNGLETTRLLLHDVLYAPAVGYTLVSIGRLDILGYHASFGDRKLEIHNPNGHRIGVIPRTGHGLYRIVVPASYCPIGFRDIDETAAVEKVTLCELHHHMGHIAPNIVKNLVIKGLITGIRLRDSPEPFTHCNSCVYAKAQRQSIPDIREGPRATEYGAEVHSDVWGPSKITTLAGRRYYVSFTDDFTHKTHLYLLKKKSEVFSIYRDYEVWCRAQRNAPIKILRSDHGGEYLGEVFIRHLKAAGTVQKLAVHDTQQNGVTERLNRMLMERIRKYPHV
jgi:hypothetical protein